MTGPDMARMEVFFVLALYIAVPGLILALFTAWWERDEDE